VRREVPGPGQESVWDYPRPPRLEPTLRRIRIVFAGVTIVDTTDAWRVLETSHPPNYYIPPAAFPEGALVPSPGGSVCEWKGRAAYLSVRAAGRVAESAAWTYPDPTPGFAALAGYVAVYPAAMDACLVDDEIVTPQPGSFYGGWITSDVVGPFKGVPGSWGW
jgi:uncharacterized protein (DUF427 family)